MNETIMDGIWIINVGHEVGKLNPCHVILRVLLGIFAAIIIFGIICEMLEDIFDIDTSDSWISILCVFAYYIWWNSRRMDGSNFFRKFNYRRYYL